jgi:hypothetical protein
LEVRAAAAVIGIREVPILNYKDGTKDAVEASQYLLSPFASIAR